MAYRRWRARRNARRADKRKSYGKNGPEYQPLAFPRMEMGMGCSVPPTFFNGPGTLNRHAWGPEWQDQFGRFNAERGNNPFPDLNPAMGRYIWGPEWQDPYARINIQEPGRIEDYVGNRNIRGYRRAGQGGQLPRLAAPHQAPEPPAAVHVAAARQAPVAPPAAAAAAGAALPNRAAV